MVALWGAESHTSFPQCFKLDRLRQSPIFPNLNRISYFQSSKVAFKFALRETGSSVKFPPDGTRCRDRHACYLKCTYDSLRGARRIYDYQVPGSDSWFYASQLNCLGS